jgi:hypothetical protein
MAAAPNSTPLTGLDIRPPSLPRTLVAWGVAALLDVVLRAGEMRAVVWLVSRLRPRERDREDNVRRARDVVAPIERALLFYPRQIRCFHSAATATALLRMNRVPCELVVGVRRIPFMAHAWVEVDGRVVMNEELGRMHLYRPITRC